MDSDIPSFVSVSWEIYPPTVLVKCDQERDRDNPGLLGVVKIDGVVYKCTGVERHLPLSPIRVGEIIGLRIET